MQVKDEAQWAERKRINSDPYGTAILTYAERWADLMEAATEGADDVAEAIVACAERTSHEADTDGITGFMYGAAVAELCADWGWVHGDILKKWHNKEWGRPDAEGVVNPAILTIGPADD